MVRKTPEDITAAVVARLRELRIEKGVSQNQLSQIAGLSRTGLRHIEAGEVQPSFANVVRLAQALELPLNELIRGLETM